MRNNLTGWAMVAVAVIALALFAFMFRYEPIPGQQGWVWDRLGHRACITFPLSQSPGPHCTAAGAR